MDTVKECLIRKQAIEIGTMKVDGLTVEYWIVVAPCEGALNGYACFPTRPVVEPDYNGIIAYVPVHGGVTLAHEYSDGMVYGFDTLHYDSHNYPRFEKEWIRDQIKVMIHGILVAAKVEKKYLLAKTEAKKAIYAQKVQDVGDPVHQRNFGVAINLLSGKL